MKAVLISTKPKWCKLIANGKKTIEVRKSHPMLELPFKCYIYCTKDNPKFEQSAFCKDVSNGKVIGEFVCEEITEIHYHDWSGDYGVPKDLFFANIFAENTCLNYEELDKYLQGKDGYGWHISDLVIYDKPKELNEFFFPSKKYCEKGLCGDCPKYEIPSYEYGEVEFDCEWKKPIEKAPQSWCYVEVAK